MVTQWGCQGLNLRSVSAWTVFLQAVGYLCTYLQCTCERIQAHFVKKCWVCIFMCMCHSDCGHVVVPENMQKLTLSLWISQWNWDQNQNQTHKQTKNCDMIRKAAVPLNALFQNAVFSFASLGLQLGKKKSIQPFIFFFSPIVLRQLPQVSW